MERARSSTRLTYADYVQFPDDGLRHEIIDGEHYVTPSPATRHQRIALKLAHAIQTHLDSHPLGELFIAPFDVVLSDSDIVVPDLIYLSQEHRDRLNDKNLRGAPDLAIEILSPSTRSRDLKLKRDAYERTGVEEYWTVDPAAEHVDVHRRHGSGFLAPARLTQGCSLTTPLLPGLQLSIETMLSSRE